MSIPQTTTNPEPTVSTLLNLATTNIAQGTFATELKLMMSSGLLSEESLKQEEQQRRESREILRIRQSESAADERAAAGRVAVRDRNAELDRAQFEQRRADRAERKESFRENRERQIRSQEPARAESGQASHENTADRSGASGEGIQIVAFSGLNTQAGSIAPPVGMKDKAAASVEFFPREGPQTAWETKGVGVGSGGPGLIPGSDFSPLGAMEASTILPMSQQTGSIMQTSSLSAAAAGTVLTIFNMSGKMLVGKPRDESENDSGEETESAEGRIVPASCETKAGIPASAESKRKKKSDHLFAELLKAVTPRRAPGTLSHSKSFPLTESGPDGMSWKPLEAEPDHREADGPVLTETRRPAKDPSEEDLRKQTERETISIPVDRVALVRRVVAAMESAANRNGPIRVRMAPDTLGSVFLKVRIRDGKISARIFAETEETRALLLEYRDDLAAGLARHDMIIEHFEVFRMNE